MKVDIYRGIEYRYLELFRNWALSKEFSPILDKLDNTILFSRNIYRVEEPTKKEEVLEYLSEFYETTEEVEYFGIKSLFNNKCCRQGRIACDDFWLVTMECTLRTRLRNKSKSGQDIRDRR